MPGGGNGMGQDRDDGLARCGPHARWYCPRAALHWQSKVRSLGMLLDPALASLARSAVYPLSLIHCFLGMIWQWWLLMPSFHSMGQTQQMVCKRLSYLEIYIPPFKQTAWASQAGLQHHLNIQEWQRAPLTSCENFLWSRIQLLEH